MGKAVTINSENGIGGVVLQRTRARSQPFDSGSASASRLESLRINNPTQG